MHVNGLFVDVDGAAVVPDVRGWRVRPTVLLLHGGPGADHTAFKPQMAALTRWAQVVYLDQRGGGRSTRGAAADWNLRTWTDDVRVVCQTLGIESPILLGQSFGTLVAMRYAIDYPDRIGGLILASPYASGDLSSSYPLFEKLGGSAARRAAERFWERPSRASLASYRRMCVPLYAGRPASVVPHRTERSMRNMRDDVLLHYARGEHNTVDLRAELHRIRCPALILTGRRDPLTPPLHAYEIASLMMPTLATVHVPAGAGHHVFTEAPRASMRAVGDFLQS